MTDQIDEAGKNFLLELFRQTDGKTSAKASMYDIGAALGMEKQDAKHIAEELMGWNLIEIRTLSGGIAITNDGIEKARQMGATGGTAAAVGLGNALILDDAAHKAVENVINGLKAEIGKSGLNFETLNELVADIRTVDAQLFSSKPKTAIIRECFRSVKAALEKTGAKECLMQVKNLLGE